MNSLPSWSGHLWSLVNTDRVNGKERPYSMPLLNDRRHQRAICTSNHVGIHSLPQYHASHLDFWLWFLILLPTWWTVVPLSFSLFCPPCATACPWLACLAKSSTAHGLLPYCLESLTVCLRPKQIPQPWNDALFNYCGSWVMTPELIC